MRHRSARIFAWVAVACFACAGVLHAAGIHLYVGTYTRGTDSKGIYVYQFDDATGELKPLSVAEGVENPSFLAIHPNKRFLYSSDEIDLFEGDAQGAISAWAIDDKTGALTLLNKQGAGGTGPCHLTVDPAGRNVLAVGYGSGTVAMLPIDADGKLQPLSAFVKHRGSSVNADRQTSPHPHQIVVDASGNYALVPDLGLDQILVYRAHDLSHVGATKTAPGAGPRHLAFAPDGLHAYGINELDLTITAFDYDPTVGKLTLRDTLSAIADGADRAGVTGAEIAVHPSGKFLYASLRGTDEIVAYAIEPANGNLEFLQRIATGGTTPRNFALDPSGQWLLVANQNSGDIRVFRIGSDGQLSPTDNRAAVPAAVCLQFVAP
ncbi:MAG: lactonase family protein [Pirellulales bacterium]